MIVGSNSFVAVTPVLCIDVPTLNILNEHIDNEYNERLFYTC